MAQLLIRDLDAGTIERLKARATLHRRSLQCEVRLILENEAAASRDDPWALAERIRAAFGGKRFNDSAELIREDRGRRIVLSSMFQSPSSGTSRTGASMKPREGPRP